MSFQAAIIRTGKRVVRQDSHDFQDRLSDICKIAFNSQTEYPLEFQLSLAVLPLA
jgi:hypothetical protein